MRVLWIATKPPLPPVDGGRLVQKLTLEALAARGVEVTLVAPLFPGFDQAALERDLSTFCEPHLVPVEHRSLWRSLAAARPGGLPLAVARHAHPAVARRVAALVVARATSDRPFDLVHAEQLHALPQARPAAEAGLPVVLRAQNVESDLWRAAADLLAGSALAPRALVARLEARRLARWEGRAVRQAAQTVALTRPDARRLEELAGRAGKRVEVVPAPFPAELPAGPRPLPGQPAVVILGSAGWAPNRDAERFMVEDVWPVVRRRLPGAVLHLFGNGGGAGESETDGVERHPAPEDSAEAFAPGSVLAVPLRVASGVRMKILEAWARGVPVVATPQAAAGLGAEDGRELLVAADAEGFASALSRFAAGPELGGSLVTAARRRLAEHHAPAEVARALMAIYQQPQQEGRV